tara:strand:+ start:524 stop:1198 length:675 start_codon:yes stop_codon:yes gene_type:complete
MITPLKKGEQLHMSTKCYINKEFERLECLNGNLYITNQRIIFEVIPFDVYHIFDFDQVKSFRYKLGSSGIFFGTDSELYIITEEEYEISEFYRNKLHLPNLRETNILPDLELMRHKFIENKAIQCEKHLDYGQAVALWEKIEKYQEAARVRKVSTKKGAVKVDQTVVQGDQITKTEIKDSVLNRSNVGGGSTKMQELEKLTEMKKEGLIDDDEFKQMKKEIMKN